MKQLACALAFALASHVCVSFAEEEDNFVYIPAPAQEAIIIIHPMGKLVVNGWDRPEVRIHAHKHAPNEASLDRLKVNVEMADGRVKIRSGVRTGDRFVTLPPPEQGNPKATPETSIDLTIDAPRQVKLTARTWSGDLEASGFRAGAELASSRGEVRARDIRGPVRTQADFGRQKLSAIRGDVDAHGVTGDLELDTVDGDTLEANVVEGQITARDVTTPVVRLLSTSGGIVFIGTVRAGGRYELTTLDGDLRLELQRVPFSVTARAGAEARSAFPIAGRVTPVLLDGTHLGGGPQLLLTADKGHILLQPR